MRELFYISVPVVCFLAFMFVLIATTGEHDMTAVAAATTLFLTYGVALSNLVRERTVEKTPFARLYFGVWIYSAVVLGGVVLARFLNHPA